jgi:hypothetical protein
MLHFALIWVGLLFLGAALFPFSLGIFPIPVAVLVARNQWKYAAALLAAAALTPVANIALYVLVESFGRTPEELQPGIGDLARLTAGTTLGYIAYGFAGVLAGVGIARLWSYGRLVHVLAIYVFALMVVTYMLSAGVLASQLAAVFETVRVTLHEQAEQAGREVVQAQLDVVTWWEKNAASWVFGVYYAAIFVASCAFVSLTRFILSTRFGDTGPVGTFTQMRPSEWLVWPAIASALLCIAYQQWPLPTLSIAGFNSAIGLGSVYGVNGLSVILYGVHAFRPNWLIFVLIVFVLVNLGGIPLLVLIGLFDTWGDYRRKIDAIVAARSKRNGPDGDRMV